LAIPHTNSLDQIPAFAARQEKVQKNSKKDRIGIKLTHLFTELFTIPLTS
jgi:hypothetical protein